jgi:ubiquinone/menaquinone biosynthesis C-methylase UbiE
MSSESTDSELTAERAVAQFAPIAADYASFSYHAAGPDLKPMLAAGRIAGNERVLDIGSGPGHTALLYAPHVAHVTALDPTQTMLDEGRRMAAERGIENVDFRCSAAEVLPFADGSFDRVTSRQSAHHYVDLSAAMREVERVLAEGASFVLVDTMAPEDDELDAFLNEIELQRDPTHIRDYRVSEWRQRFAEVGLELEFMQAWAIPLEYQSWVERSRTDEAGLEGLERAFSGASSRVREAFEINDAQDWSVPVVLVRGSRRG